MIRDLQARSGARIEVEQHVPQGLPRGITYRGTRKTVDFAKQLVAMLQQPNADENMLPLGDASRRMVIIPAQAVGKIGAFYRTLPKEELPDYMLWQDDDTFYAEDEEEANSL